MVFHRLYQRLVHQYPPNTIAHYEDFPSERLTRVRPSKIVHHLIRSVYSPLDGLNLL